MNYTLKTSIGILVGIILAGLVAWNVYTLVQTTNKVNAVVSYLNNAIAQEQATQKQEAPAVPATK